MTVDTSCSTVELLFSVGVLAHLADDALLANHRCIACCWGQCIETISQARNTKLTMRIYLFCRPRITISINASGESNDQELLTLDCPSGLTIAGLKGLIEADTSFPTSIQTLFFNGQALRTETQTLEQADIKDGEMLAVMVRREQPNNNNRASNQGTPRSSNQQQRRNTAPPEVDTPQRIEEIRQELLANPVQLSGLIQQNPELADTVHDQHRFTELWMRALNERDRMQREREDEMKMLNEDPFNVDAQKKIAEMIRREKIEANLQYGCCEHILVRIG